VDYIHLAQDMYQWQALVKIIFEITVVSEMACGGVVG
jgi:hypothetical protein